MRYLIGLVAFTLLIKVKMSQIINSNSDTNSKKKVRYLYGTEKQFYKNVYRK